MSEYRIGEESLAEKLAELPSEIQPSKDLWPSIEARLEARSQEPSVPAVSDDLSSDPTPGATILSPAAWTQPQRWASQALAALFFMSVGGALTYWAAFSTLESSNPRLSQVSENVASPLEETNVQPVSAGDETRTTDSLDLVEANYLRAREALWLHALTHRESLPPGTLKVVRKNLEILERAIGDLRQALELDPGNPSLERRLMDNHQRSIDILRRVVRDV